MVIGFIAFSVMYPSLYEVMADLGNESVSVQGVQPYIEPTSTLNWLDWMLVFAYFAFNILICIVLPMYVTHNPFYYVAIFMFSFLWVFIVAVLANTLSDILLDFGVLTHSAWIINNMVLLETVFMLLMVLVMFYKRRSENFA